MLFQFDRCILIQRTCDRGRSSPGWIVFAALWFLGNPPSVMSYRLKLLFVTCLTCASLAPSAMAGIPLQSQRWVRADIRADRFSGEMRIALNRFTARQEQQMAAAPATASPSASTGSPAAGRPAASPSATPVPLASPSPTAATPSASISPLKDWIWWGAIGLLPIGVIAAALYMLHPKERQQKAAASGPKSSKAISSKLTANRTKQTHETEQTSDEAAEESQFSGVINSDRAIEPQEHLTLSTTTRLAKVDIVEALIHDLHHPAPSQRRKAIWELGQRGDSRAIQPLVDLLVDADSNQRGLILAAVTEISMRALKPINRALMLSIQDSSPDVRKNALRDVTRIFELVTQTSQLLQYVASDADAEVRETAEWALSQLHRVRPILSGDGMPSFSSHNGCINPSPSYISSLPENANPEVPLAPEVKTETLEGG